MAMYTSEDFKTKKALKDRVKQHTDAVKDGDEATAKATEVRIYSEGAGEGIPKENGKDYVAGPHGYHTWYAQVTMKDGIVVGVK